MTSENDDKRQAGSVHIPLIVGAGAGTTAGLVGGMAVTLETLPKPKPRQTLPFVDDEQLHADALSKALKELKDSGEPFTKDDIHKTYMANVDSANEQIRKGDEAILESNKAIVKQNVDAINAHVQSMGGTSVGIGAITGLAGAAIWNRLRRKKDKTDEQITR